MFAHRLRQSLAVFVCVSLLLLLPLAHLPVGTAAVSGISPAPAGGPAELNMMQFLPSVLRNIVNILDPTFGGDGRVSTDFAGERDWGSDIVMQPDGRILMAGTSGPYTAEDFALARYLADGSLDTTFDSDGKVTTDFTGSYDRGEALALQADGSILVAGYTDHGSNTDFALVRYLADGSLDTSFGNGGLVSTDFAGDDDMGYAMLLDADGNILVAGSSYTGSSDDFALARYLPDGILDPTFNEDGKVTTHFAGDLDVGYAIALQADGSLLVAGYTYTYPAFDFALARYLPDGSLDTTFGNGGLVVTDFIGNEDYGYAIAVQADGKIVVAGSAGNGFTAIDFALARYLPDGSLDISFGGDGKVTTDFSGAWDKGYDIALLADGRILVSGGTYNGLNWDFALARYLADGSLDPSFDGDGLVITYFPGGEAPGLGVALQADGKILVAGVTGAYPDYDFALLRYR